MPSGFFSKLTVPNEISSDSGPELPCSATWKFMKLGMLTEIIFGRQLRDSFFLFLNILEKFSNPTVRPMLNKLKLYNQKEFDYAVAPFN